MTNQSSKEQALQLKYPVGTMGEYRPKDSQTRAHLLSRGWEPHFAMTVRYSYIAADNTSCLFLRWGLGESDWAGVMPEGFNAIENDSPSALFQHQTLAIALGSDSTRIEKWFDEGYEAALKVECQTRECPYDDNFHTFYEHLWWNRGYDFAGCSARSLVAEQSTKGLKGGSRFKQLKEMKSNWEKLDGSGIRLLLVSGSLMTIFFLMVGFTVAQLFCLLYWWMTGASLSRFAVLASSAIAVMAIKFGLFTFTELSRSDR